jgi:four helix bundle suffix protein
MNSTNKNDTNDLSVRNNPNTQNIPNPPNTSNSDKPNTFLPQHGHYRNLRVYKVTEIIYDITYYFAQKYLKIGDRTIDQMVQAARSGKQNIAEGNQAAATSSETEIKLTNVAKASLEELLTDYEDYLRVRNLQQWEQLHPRYEKLRQYARSESIMQDYAQQIKRMNDEEISNLCITLIHQATYMLHKLLTTMQNRFITEGGIKEQMYNARANYRNAKNKQQ